MFPPGGGVGACGWVGSLGLIIVTFADELLMLFTMMVLLSRNLSDVLAPLFQPIP